jgi:hypothetical protein
MGLVTWVVVAFYVFQGEVALVASRAAEKDRLTSSFIRSTQQEHVTEQPQGQGQVQGQGQGQGQGGKQKTAVAGSTSGGGGGGGLVGRAMPGAGNGVIDLDSGDIADNDDGDESGGKVCEVIDGGASECGDGECDGNEEDIIDAETSRIAGNAQSVINDLTLQVQSAVNGTGGGVLDGDEERDEERTPVKARQPEAMRGITLKG